MDWSPSTRRLAAAALCVVGALAGCGTGSAVHSPIPATPIPLESSWRAGLFVDGYGPQGLGPAATSATSSADPVQVTLAGLGITTEDFGTGYSVKLMPDGNTLTQSSMRYCGADYPSEKNRVARRLTALYDTNNNRVGPLSDAVEYDTSEHAAAALDEVRAELTTCKAHTVVNKGEAQLVVDPQPSDGVLLTNLLPESQRAVMTQVVTEPSSGSSALIQTLWQQAGPYVVALTFEGDPKVPFTGTEQEEFNALGGKIANRLAQTVAG